MKYKITIGVFEFEADISPIIENTDEPEVVKKEPAAEPDLEEPIDEPITEPEEPFNEPMTELDPEEPFDEPITVMLGDDPEKNRDILNEALEQGDVAVDNTGEFRIAPGVIVNGRTLDLKGSVLIGSVEPLYGGAYIELRGQSPCIRNGSFAGHYTAAPGEAGYNHVEYDGLGIETAVGLPIGDFSDALIEGVTFEHVSGYVICPRGDSSAVRHVSAMTSEDDGWQRYALTPGYPLITARHGIGYGYQISTGPVRYRFYTEDGDLIGEASGIPGEAVSVPDGAVEVLVLTSGEYVRYALDEYKYDNRLTIDGCTFRCNQRLGIANLPGASVVRDCVSVSNGYPREDHTGIMWDSSTTGFMDIEDVQSPRLMVINCTSANENLGVASRAYELIVKGGNVPVCVYGGWTVDVYNHVGRVTHAGDSVKARISVHESDLREMGAAQIGPNFETVNSKIELCSALNRIRDFNCLIGEDYVRSVCVYLNDVVVGRISGRDGWFELGTKGGSELYIDVSVDDTSGVRAAVSDCWGLDSNLLVIPNGHVINECRFRLAEPRAYRQWITGIVADGFCGAYEDCDFKVTVDEPFRATAAWMDKPVELKFRRCRFSVEDGLALTKGFKAGSVIRFEDCTLNSEPITQEDIERIAAHDPTGIKVVAE